MTCITRPVVTSAMLARFRAYNTIHTAWGDLHVVLDDLNLDDRAVDYCVENSTGEGQELAVILRTLSKTQRGRIAKEASGYGGLYGVVEGKPAILGRS